MFKLAIAELQYVHKNLKNKGEFLILISIFSDYIFTKLRRVEQGLIALVRLVVSVSARGQFCLTRSNNTTLQLMLFCIPGTR